MTADSSLRLLLGNVGRQYLLVAGPSPRIIAFSVVVAIVWGAVTQSVLDPVLGAIALLLALLCFRELPSPTRYLGGAASICALTLCAVAAARTAQPAWLHRVSIGLVLIGTLSYAHIAVQHLQFSSRLSRMAPSLTDEELIAEMPLGAAQLARAWVAQEIVHGSEVREALRLATLYAAITIGMKQSVPA